MSIIRNQIENNRDTIAEAVAVQSSVDNIVTTATGGTETRPRNIALMFCTKT